MRFNGDDVSLDRKVAEIYDSCVCAGRAHLMHEWREKFAAYGLLRPSRPSARSAAAFKLRAHLRHLQLNYHLLTARFLRKHSTLENPVSVQ